MVQFLHVYTQNIYNFVFEIREMIEKVKLDVDRLLLILIMQNKISIDFAKIEIFFIFQSKSPLLSSLPHFPNFEILDTNM